jgi:N-acetylneuraminate epimerase
MTPLPSSGADTGPGDSGFVRSGRALCWWTAALLASMVGCGAGAANTMESPANMSWSRLPDLPDPEGFASAFAGISHGALLVAGGANFPTKRPWEGGAKVWYDQVFVLESPTGSWRVGGRLPRPNAYGVSFTTSAGVICAGGGDAHAHSSEVLLLDWDGRQATTRALPALPRPVAFGSGVSFGNVLYLIGGLDRPDATAALEGFLRLDLSTAEPAWEELPPCPGPARILAQLGEVNGVLYVCGGVALRAGPDGKPIREYLRDAYSYNPQVGWRQLADLPYPVAAAPSPMPINANGELLIISGDDGTRGHLIGPNHPGFKRETLAYDPVRNVWRLAGDGPISRATAPTARWSEWWIVASGERKPGYRSPEVWVLRHLP